MTHITCRLTAKNRDQLRNPTLGSRVWATCTFFFYRCGLAESVCYVIYCRNVHQILSSGQKHLHMNTLSLSLTHTHARPFNGPFSRTTRVSQYQKGKTNLDSTEARDSEWQWHQLGHMQVCTSLQTENHASTTPLSFYRPNALPAT